MSRLRYLVVIYFWFVLVFVLQKPLFMFWQGDLYAGISFLDWLRVMWHGLPLDLSVSAYIMVLPMLLAMISIWLPGRWLLYILRGYFGIIIFLLSLICVADAELYGYWGFRIDVTPLFYLQSPADAMASVPVGMFFVAFLFVVLYVVAVGYPLDRWLLRPMANKSAERRRVFTTGVYLFLTAFLFLPIRGGVSASTMNVGWAYFSERIELNHAAVNPAFSLMSSVSKGEDFSNQYRFMTPAEADAAFAPLAQRPVVFPDSTGSWLSTHRPDIVLVILESFTGHILDMPEVMPRLKALSEEGIYFPHFYANSFRTDRGLVSILSGYPAQPTASIMKSPSKSQSLPAIARSLRKVGYDTEMIYGGDADFTNMRSYLVSSGIEKIISDKDFPLSERTGKWGAQDHVLFQRLMKDLKEEKQKEPFLKLVQTSSSHEPFEVPFHRLYDKILNSFAYADSCVGDFVKQYQETPLWKNTLFVLVPDHQGAYPYPIENPLDGQTIPLILIGGAIKQPLVVDTYASQIDIAATLLAQLGLPHDEFTFSKNIMNPASPHFAYFTRPNYFGMITADNQLVYNLDANTVQLDEGTAKGANLEKGKAFLQKLYDDLAKR